MNTVMIAAFLLGSVFKTDCIQTQSSQLQGYVIDTVAFGYQGAPHDITFSREWFTDSFCQNSQGKNETEKGTYLLGSMVSTQSLFSSQNLIEADFSIEGRMDKELGAISVSSDKDFIQIARGLGRFRNTMVSLFKYKKQN